MLRYLTAAAVMAVFVGTSVLQAQRFGRPPGRGFGRGGFGDGLASLVAIPEVQRELRLNQQQQELLEELRADLRGQIRRVFFERFEGRGRPGRGDGSSPGEGRDASEEDRAQIDDARGRTRAESVQQKMQAINGQSDRLVKMILEPKQVHRANQLRLQRDGVRAFQRRELIKELGLTEAQLETIRALSQADEETRDERGPGNATDRQRRARREQFQADMLAVLTPKQKEAWEKMKGRAFEFPERSSRFGRRGPRGRRRGEP